MHTRTRSEYKSFVDSVYPKPYYSPPRMSKCVMITVWCHHRHSGDVICIQGRDLSTEYHTHHLLILFISKTLLLLIALLHVALLVKMCHDYCLMPTPTVEMSYAYKDEIGAQVICDSVLVSFTVLYHSGYLLIRLTIGIFYIVNYRYLLGCIKQKNWPLVLP